MAENISTRPYRWRLRNEERRFILILGDFIATSLAMVIALIIWGQRDWLNLSRELMMTRIPTWFFFLPILWMLISFELYGIRKSGRRNDTLKGLGVTFLIGLSLYLLLFFLSSPSGTDRDLPRLGVIVFLVFAGILTAVWRLTYIRVFTQPEFLRRVLIVGAGRAGTTLTRVIHDTHPSPFYLIGLIDDDPEKQNKEIEGYRVLGGSERLLELVDSLHVSDLIFAISNEMRPEMLQVLLHAEERGVEISTMPMVYEQLMGRVPIFLLQSDWVVRSFVDHAHTSGLFEFGKRVLDIVGGLVGSLITLVLFPFIALATYLDSGAPVMFFQKRLGRNGKEYEIIKFRTMVVDAEKDGKARVTVENDQRITRIGNILRKSHLDELPQFLNVLRGEMSLVGPRAERTELVNQLQRKVPFYRARLLVKPGITGWAQVNFGYAATVEDTAVKLEYDLYYIKHRNLLLDVIILLRTVGQVVGFRGQ